MKSIAILFLVAFSVTAILGYVPEKKKNPIESGSVSHRHSTYALEATRHVLKHSTKYQIIVAPSLPIRFNDINYYWYGHYIPDRRQPTKCDYHFDENDHEFRNVTYPDGSRPRSLEFGCLSYQQCCGLECCGDSRSASLFVWCFLLVILGVYIAFRKYAEIKKQQRGSTSSSAITVNNPRNDPNIEIHEV